MPTDLPPRNKSCPAERKGRDLATKPARPASPAVGIARSPKHVLLTDTDASLALLDLLDGLNSQSNAHITSTMRC